MQLCLIPRLTHHQVHVLSITVQFVDFVLLTVAVIIALVSRPSSVKSWERRVWSIEESLAELVACVAEVWNISRQAREEGKCDMLGSYVFDKDFR